MIDQRTLEVLREKLGGDFHLVSLFQKRMRELAQGLPPLVGGDTADLWQLVIDEILQNKLQLATGEEAERLRQELEALPERTTGTAVAQHRRPAAPPRRRVAEIPQDRVTNVAQ